MNGTCALTDTYSYDPYGATAHTLGTSINGYLFAGQDYDFNNLYFMRRRYYLPAIGRFLSRDPIGIAGGINVYAYANDDPVDFSDPTGLCTSAVYDGAGAAGLASEAAHTSRGRATQLAICSPTREAPVKAEISWRCIMARTAAALRLSVAM